MSSSPNISPQGKDLLDIWPSEELEHIHTCPVCGSERCAMLYSELKDEIFKVAPGLWTLYQCKQCNNAWLNPRPTAVSIGRAYSSYYTHDSSDHPIIRRKGMLRTFLHDAMNGYRNSRYDLTRQQALKLGRWLIPLLPSIQAAVDAQCRHLPRISGQNQRLLDVGFGNGGFLKLAEEMGWQAEGIDFDPAAVEAARSRGLNAHLGSADALNLKHATYDVITISHVIEHVHDPIALLSSLFSGLKPGGMLWLDTPNLESKGHRRFGRNWRGLEPPRHLVLFGRSGLMKVLSECGFIDIQQRWRGLSVFDVFPASEALERSTDPLQSSRQGHPPLREILAEFDEMLRPKQREFITLTAYKPSSA